MSFIKILIEYYIICNIFNTESNRRFGGGASVPSKPAPVQETSDEEAPPPAPLLPKRPGRSRFFANSA